MALTSWEQSSQEIPRFIWRDIDVELLHLLFSYNSEMQQQNLVHCNSHCQSYFLLSEEKRKQWEDGKITELLGTLAALPSAHMTRSHNLLQLQFLGTQHRLLTPSHCRYTHDAQTHIQAKHPST